MIGRHLDLGNPVSDHPLNRGLVALLQALPNLAGAKTIPGLLPGRPAAGSLSATASTFAWQGARGFGTKTPPGSSLGTFTLPSGIDTSTGGESLTVEIVATWLGQDSGTANISGLWQMPNWFVRLGDGGIGNNQPQFNGGQITSTPTVAAGRPFSIVTTHHNNDGHEMYLDGVSVGTAAYVSNCIASTAAMLADDTGGRAGATWVHRFAVYDRKLTAAEVWHLDDQSRREWPDLLRRYSSRAYSFGADAGGGGGAVVGSGLTRGLKLERLSLVG